MSASSPDHAWPAPISVEPSSGRLAVSISAVPCVRHWLCASLPPLAAL
jgi:hypothetical protein